MTSPSRREQLVRSLSDKEYRHALVEEHIANGIPIQIRALREREEWTQEQLGDHVGMAQSTIARIERVGYDGYTVKTLARIAAAFDVALIIKFAPFSELVNRMDGLTKRDILVPRFEEDAGLNPLDGDGVLAFKSAADAAREKRKEPVAPKNSAATPHPSGGNLGGSALSDKTHAHEAAPSRAS